jgi:hypothetical protein
MPTSTVALNRAFRYFTLTSYLLMIVARLLDCDMETSILVIGLSVGVLANVAIGSNDDPRISLNIGLGLGLT